MMKVARLAIYRGRPMHRKPFSSFPVTGRMEIATLSAAPDLNLAGLGSKFEINKLMQYSVQDNFHEDGHRQMGMVR